MRTCQTEWEQEGKSCQTEWEQEGKSCQTEWQQEGKSCQTEWEQEGVACQMECDQKGVECQTEIDCEAKETQTEYGPVTKVEGTQTERAMDVKLCQTEWEQQGVGCQTEIENADEKTQTEIEETNIITVDKIELVEHMETQGCQMDLAELAAMEPFYKLQTPDPSESGDNKEDAETESITCVSLKCEDVKVGAGLDMRRGVEYHEVNFLPVASTIVKHKPGDSAPKQRTPSPINLCTTSKVPVSKKKKKIDEDSTPKKKKVPPLCAVFKDPRDVLRGVTKQKQSDLVLTLAHGSVSSGRLSKLDIPPKIDVPAADLRKKDTGTLMNEDSGIDGSPTNEDTGTPGSPTYEDIGTPTNEVAPTSKQPSALGFSAISGRQFIDTHGSTLSRMHGNRPTSILGGSFSGSAGLYTHESSRSVTRNLLQSMSFGSPQRNKRPSGDIDDSLGEFVNTFTGGSKRLCLRNNTKTSSPFQQHQLVKWNPRMMTMIHGSEVTLPKKRRLNSPASSASGATEYVQEGNLDIIQSSVNVPMKVTSASGELQMNINEPGEAEIQSDEEDRLLNDSQEEDSGVDDYGGEDDEFLSDGYDSNKETIVNPNLSINVDRDQEKCVITRKEEETIPYSDGVGVEKDQTDFTAVNIAVMDNDPDEKQDDIPEKEDNSPEKSAVADETIDGGKLNTSRSSSRSSSSSSS